MSKVVLVVVVACIAARVVAQDPAEGWLGYAMGVNPAGTGIITHMEAKWKVGQNPVVGGAFFSPWFGIEASDNLNLLQPVNPWVGDSWQIYNEYFQWSPEYNYNSDSNTVNPGDVLFGSVDYDESAQSYNLYHSDMTTGWSVNSTIQIQQDDQGNYKQYTIAYVVYEKDADCNQYPPDGSVTFYDIVLAYGGKVVTPQWTTGIVDDVCNNRAKVIDSNTIEITWDTSMSRNATDAGADS